MAITSPMRNAFLVSAALTGKGGKEALGANPSQEDPARRSVLIMAASLFCRCRHHGWDRMLKRRALIDAWLLGTQVALPFGDHRGRDRVAYHIGGASTHIEELDRKSTRLNSCHLV